MADGERRSPSAIGYLPSATFTTTAAAVSPAAHPVNNP
jgi:hypothetical protein